MTDAAPAGIRIDKWLWQARFFKTRSLAAKLVGAGAVRVNGTRVTKPAATVRPGDALTFAQGARVRVVVIRALGTRRGPATEAQELYEDRSPPPPERQPADPALAPAPGADRSGRPEKKERRALDALRRTDP